jgi:hypothetical protein
MQEHWKLGIRPILTLGPRKSASIGRSGVRMRIADDVRDTVVFLGYPSSAPEKGGIDCIGTAFCSNTMTFRTS